VPDPDEEVVEARDPAEEAADLGHLDAAQRVGVVGQGRPQVGDRVGEGLVEAEASRHPGGLACTGRAHALRLITQHRRQLGEVVPVVLDLHLVLAVCVVDRHCRLVGREQDHLAIAVRDDDLRPEPRTLPAEQVVLLREDPQWALLDVHLVARVGQVAFGGDQDVATDAERPDPGPLRQFPGRRGLDGRARGHASPPELGMSNLCTRDAPMTSMPFLPRKDVTARLTS
jgi:hypothetical protein